MEDSKYIEILSDAFDKWLDGLANGGVEKEAYDVLRKHASLTYGVTPDSGLAKMYAVFICGLTIGTTLTVDELPEEE